MFVKPEGSRPKRWGFQSDRVVAPIRYGTWSNFNIWVFPKIGLPRNGWFIYNGKPYQNG